jgi:hypothetical protein
VFERLCESVNEIGDKEGITNKKEGNNGGGGHDEK